MVTPDDPSGPRTLARDRPAAYREGPRLKSVPALEPTGTTPHCLSNRARSNGVSEVTHLSRTDVIMVDDASLRTDRVFRPGTNVFESAAHFDEQTCTGVPVSLPTFRGVFGVVALVVAALFLGFVVRR